MADRWAGANEPIAVFVHVACPRINFTDRGKAGAVLPHDASRAIIDAVETVTARWCKQRRAEDRHASARLRREAALASQREVRMTVKDAARQVMKDAYDLVSGNGSLPANARQMMYKARPKILKLTGKDGFTSRYFTQTLLPNYVDDNPEETADWDIVFDARGNFVEPHTKLSVPLGTIEVRKYLKERPWHTALHIASSEYYSTVGPENRFENVLFIEKEGFDSLLKAARITQRFDIATTSTKGMSVTAQRELLDALAERGVKKVFVMHDFDVSGIGILGTLGTSSRRYKFKNRVNIIDIGLRLSDVHEMRLESEPCVVKGDWEKRKQTLIRHGATTDEIAFLRTQRVELNAMTSPQFIEFIETKLTEHGVKKLIPDPEILKAHWRRLRAEHSARKAFKEIRQKCEDEAAAATPPANLAQRVAEALQRDPELPWDLALAFNDFQESDEAGVTP